MKTISKVDFLIVGTQKGGTSSLDYYLRQHRQVQMGEKKELHFFDDEEVFSTDIVDYSILHNQFSEHTNDRAIFGDATPIYMYWEPSMKRIWSYNKKIKLIAILRNPISRAFSHWNMEVNRKAETNTFMYSILTEHERIKEALPSQHRVFSYLDRGFYSEQIRRIKRYFPEEQILFLKYEDYEVNQEERVKDTLRFLGLDVSEYKYIHKKVHKREYREDISVPAKDYLLKVFENDIREVERILNWDCSDWLN